MRLGINTSVDPDPGAGLKGLHEGLDQHKCLSRPEYDSLKGGLAFILTFSI